MNNTATLSLTDYFLEFGNHFFNIENEEWMNLQDDLSYESTETKGINGFVLKFEKQAGGIGSHIRKNIIVIINWFTALLFKESNIENTKETSFRKKYRRVSQQQMIHNKVRSHLMDVINEDVDIWLKQQKTPCNRPKGRSPIRKNQFKSNRLE